MAGFFAGKKVSGTEKRLSCINVPEMVPDTFSPAFQAALGVTEVVPRGQIEAFASTGLSLMPEGLEKGLTTQDLADLMAFVKSIQHSPASPGLQPGR